MRDSDVSPLAGSFAEPEAGLLRAIIARQAAVIESQAAEIERARTTFARASTLARIGFWECSLPDGRIAWSDAVYDIYGLPRGEPLSRATTLRLYTTESLKALIELRARAIAERTSFCIDAEVVTPARELRWVRITASVECDGDRPIRLFGLKRDITAEKAEGDRTRYLAEHDALTRLPNRVSFRARMASAESGTGLGALILIDLDGFKSINDTLGHARGDELLKLAAGRIRDAVGAQGHVARLGGDEFAALMARSLSPERTERIAATIVASLAEPFELSGIVRPIGGSVGIAHADTCDPAELFGRADAALYAAKASGRSSYKVFALPSRAA
ncbi:MAG: sensor domain-containing diguanylate cyclase [Hansschlegelia sp.]